MLLSAFNTSRLVSLLTSAERSVILLLAKDNIFNDENWNMPEGISATPLLENMKTLLMSDTLIKLRYSNMLSTPMTIVSGGGDRIKAVSRINSLMYGSPKMRGQRKREISAI
jgi:hypothetical protein